jgi:osmoprotectant transport system ATP-binding protein
MFAFDAAFKSFGGKAAVDDLTFAVPPRKTTVIIGPSGCGKSTIFGLMTGLLKPDKGVVTFEGHPLSHTNLQGIRRRIGFVVQDGGLFPHLTCRANVSIMAAHLRWKTDRIEARVLELAAMMRLSPDILVRYPGEVSGGERQRISLMRGLMLDADVLLLDEALGSLDPMVRAELQEDLAAVFRRLSKTVVMVTHDINEAAVFADHVILMRAGRIVQMGTVEELFNQPAEPFVADFVHAQRQREPSRGPR